MDSTTPQPFLQASAMIDTVMGESNGEQASGFVDPRVLAQSYEQVQQRYVDSEMDGSPEDSEATSSLLAHLSARKVWLPTGVCYDDRMKLHANADFSGEPHHPEDPRRIAAIMAAFKEAGLVFEGTQAELDVILKESPTKWMSRIAARAATREEILTVHSPMHYEWVAGLSVKPSLELREMSTMMDNGRKSLYVGNLTFEAALVAAGGAIETCKNVVAGVVKNAIAVIRPPGHHAEPDESMGFCIFNNVPIAAKVCMEDYPELCRKILILDWDVHHGNGIQNMFYDDPNVLYISLHVYQNGEFYPNIPPNGTPDGNFDKCGSGVGIGKNVNIAWHDQGMGDGEYMAAFEQIVMPIATEFDPDLVIVSAGFDAAVGDELGGCFVTPACYSQMTHMLMSLANGKMAVCLEGGYNLKAISRSALAVAKTLMGEPPERIVLPPIHRTALHVLQEVRNHQAPYWECMRSSSLDITKIRERGDPQLDAVSRVFQRHQMQEKLGMIPLYIQRDKINEPFENQVLVTQGINAARKIVLIIHDPPEIVANLDPVTRKVISSNAYLNDPVLPYITTLIARGYGIIDINIPLPPSSIETLTAIERHQPTPTLLSPTPTRTDALTLSLLTYLWDNYLEPWTSPSILLLGIGAASSGLRQLLLARDCKDRLAAIVSFNTWNTPLKPLKSETDAELAAWYKGHSRVYVAGDHVCWSSEEDLKRVRKMRFGGVVRSRGVGLGEMLAEHMTDAFEYIDTSVEEKLAEVEEEEQSEEVVGGL